MHCPQKVRHYLGAFLWEKTGVTPLSLGWKSLKRSCGGLLLTRYRKSGSYPPLWSGNGLTIIRHLVHLVYCRKAIIIILSKSREVWSRLILIKNYLYGIAAGNLIFQVKVPLLPGSGDTRNWVWMASLNSVEDPVLWKKINRPLKNKLPLPG